MVLIVDTRITYPLVQVTAGKQQQMCFVIVVVIAVVMVIDVVIAIVSVISFHSCWL